MAERIFQTRVKQGSLPTPFPIQSPKLPSSPDAAAESRAEGTVRSNCKPGKIVLVALAGVLQIYRTPPPVYRRPEPSSYLSID